eukprot:gene29502-38605_t
MKSTPALRTFTHSTLAAKGDAAGSFKRNTKISNSRIPSSSANFRYVRENGFAYVDKTKDIWENFVGVGSCNYHFLARPRRFGKSLLCSTIAELFQGDANLFEELYIYDKWDFKAEQCPVIHIKMDLFPSDNANLFAIQVSAFLHEIAVQNDLSLSSSVDCGVYSLLSDLVRKLHRKHGKGVVVIIDEYDTPLQSFLNRPEELEVVRNELSKLYGVLKSLEDYLRLVYLTGILNFSSASLFSGLNNIEDHTFSRNLNSICGYTREELESNFEDHLNHFATEKMMSYDELMTKLSTNFNGYRFSVGFPIDNLLPPTVFNPFAINRAIESETFHDQWIESGHCEQLVSLILKSRASGKALEDMSIFLADIDSISTPSELSYQCLMYCAGYTTIHGYNHKTGVVTLAPPNYSIGQSVMKVIAQTIFKDVVVNKKDLKLARALVNEILSSTEHDVGKQVKAVERILNYVVLLFPWQLLKTNEKDLESTYNVMLNSFMQLGCSDHTYIGSEISVSTGGMECVIESKGKEVVAIFEFTLFKSALVAMNQMKRKSFADRFPDQAVIFVAINITKERTVEVLIERSAGH